MKTALAVGGPIGIGILILILLRTDLGAMQHLLAFAGAGILWLIPYRLLYFFLYAAGWRRLLTPHVQRGRFGIGYAFFATAVREAVDRLLPVASVGGGIVGAKLAVARGVPAAAAGAVIAVEVLLTLIAAYVFTGLSFFLAAQVETSGVQLAHVRLGLSIGLVVPLLTGILLRYGSVVARGETLLRPFFGSAGMAAGAEAVDGEIRACLQRKGACLFDLTLQIVALVSASLEVWFVMRLFGHPVSVTAAVAIEGLTQAARHAAFFVPSGIGIQEGTLLLLAGGFGFGPEMALGISAAKRIREVLCGLPALLAWHVVEQRRSAADCGRPR